MTFSKQNFILEKLWEFYVRINYEGLQFMDAYENVSGGLVMTSWTFSIEYVSENFCLQLDKSVERNIIVV